MSGLKLSAVLLAAGLSRRYGTNKLLAEVDGLPLYRRAFAALPPSLFTPAAVVSCYDEILAAAAAAGYLPVRNPDPAAGQSGSVRLGLAALDAPDAVLFAVCDQPRLTRESVAGLIAAHRAAPEHITALSCRGRRGNPVIFPARWFPALAALTGDVGGGAVLRAHPEALRLWEARSPEELDDLDIPLPGLSAE